MVLAAASSPSPLWYLTRGAGAVALVLLTLSVTLGIVNVQRWQADRWPRFVVDRLHRNVSLLVLAVLAVHILTAVLDTFTPIGLLDAIVPFGARYRPLWLGLGALAFDLLLAVAVTSMLRRRLGVRAWRAVHWFAYASWPIALVHGFGTGSDVRDRWLLILSAVCLALVLASVWTRLATGDPEYRGRRTVAFGLSVVIPLVVAVWLPGGPLAKGWSRRAGTPVHTVAARSPAAALTRSRR